MRNETLDRHLERPSLPIKGRCHKSVHGNASFAITEILYKSKTKLHSGCLQRRLNLWFAGGLDSLVIEARTIHAIFYFIYFSHKISRQTNK